MRKKRRTYEEITNDMFNELYEKGDLVLIANTNPDYWCECDDDEKCTYRKPKSGDFSTEVEIYRSMKKPELCFYYHSSIDENMNMEDLLERFDFENIENYLDVDIDVNHSIYLITKRRKKIMKILTGK